MEHTPLSPPITRSSSGANSGRDTDASCNSVLQWPVLSRSKREISCTFRHQQLLHLSGHVAGGDGCLVAHETLQRQHLKTETVNIRVGENDVHVPENVSLPRRREA